MARRGVGGGGGAESVPFQVDFVTFRPLDKKIYLQNKQMLISWKTFKQLWPFLTPGRFLERSAIFRTWPFVPGFLFEIALKLIKQLGPSNTVGGLQRESF